MTSDTEWYHGCRSTRDGGRWDFYRNEQGIVQSRDAFWPMVEGLTDDEKASRVADFMVLMKRAAAGKLRFDTEDLGDVTSHPKLLEIRWKLRKFQTEMPPVLMRLYFAEPVEVPEALWSLILHKKTTRDEDGNDIPDTALNAEQQVHMDAAELARINWLQALKP